MGLLDSKTRIVDSVITTEGRRQMATGKMKVEYYSFTDGEVSYQSSSYLNGELSVIDDATNNRFYLESPMSLPSDRITFESDDTGKLVFFNNRLNVIEGMLQQTTVSPDSVYNGTINFSQVLTGDAFSSQIDEVLSSSINNYNYLRILPTKEKLFDSEFELSINNAVLQVSNAVTRTNVSELHVPPLNLDPKFSTQINFKFLPPSFYESTNLFQTETLDLDYIKGGKSLTTNYDKTKYVGTYNSILAGLMKSIKFEMPRLSSKVVSQIFEISNDKVRKLDIVDVGEKFVDTNNNNKEYKVYFVGKAFTKSNGQTGFLNIFTLFFSKDDL